MISTVIPSYGRAHALAGAQYFRQASYVVPESQRDAYARAVGHPRVIPIPDDQDGAIARKRNWILRHIPRPLVMIDDDVSKIVYTEGGEHFRIYGRAKQMIPLQQERIEWFLANGFNLAAEWGCCVWGINCNMDGINYQQFRPFNLSGVILGPFMAHLEHAYSFDERMGTKEDYDLSLQILRGEKKLLRLNKFAYDCQHGDNPGGIVSGRSAEREEAYCRAIMAKWGDVIKYTLPPRRMADLLNGNVSVPIRGV